MKVSRDLINQFKVFKNKIATDDLASLMTAFHLSGTASQELKVLVLNKVHNFYYNPLLEVLHEMHG